MRRRGGPGYRAACDAPATRFCSLEDGRAVVRAVGWWHQMRSGHFKNGERLGEWIDYDQQSQVCKVSNMERK
jgi:hypothetical protein